jgi:hypothetical protein
MHSLPLPFVLQIQSVYPFDLVILIFCEEQFMQFSQASCHFILLRSKYFLSTSFKIPAIGVLVERHKRPGFTPIKNKYTYSFVYFNLYVFRQKAGK